MEMKIEVQYSWCKGCGICIAFCPKSVLKANVAGKPELVELGHCIGCGLCELHCPDFAIRVRKES